MRIVCFAPSERERNDHKRTKGAAQTREQKEGGMRDDNGTIIIDEDKLFESEVGKNTITSVMMMMMMIIMESLFFLFDYKGHSLAIARCWSRKLLSWLECCNFVGHDDDDDTTPPTSTVVFQENIIFRFLFQVVKGGEFRVYFLAKYTRVDQSNNRGNRTYGRFAKF